MNSLHFHGREVQLNRQGFIEDFDDWDDEVCEALAASEGLELDEHRWCAIRFLREYYGTVGVNPSAHIMIRDIGDKLAQFHCTRRDIDQLFPHGGCRQACRLAGLPEYFTHSC